jgi:stage V sporulation protein SpoVS
VNVGTNTFVERENSIPSDRQLERLRNLDFVYNEFVEDPLVYLTIAAESEGEIAAAFLAGACELLGLPAPTDLAVSLEAAVNTVFTAAALASACHVVGLVERFCAENGIELMFVLSYREGTIRSVLGGGKRFDRDFVAWLKAHAKPVFRHVRSLQEWFFSVVGRSGYLR